MKKKVGVLGATGSIGKSTVDVLRNASKDFEPVLFTAHKNAASLYQLAKEFPAAKIVLIEADKENMLEALDTKRVYYGEAGLYQAIKESEASIFVHGIAGAAGLKASFAVLDTGASLALANKESVVMAWHLIAEKAKQHNVQIIPVDSEHSAVFNLIHAHCSGHNKPVEIILTASGGPFRDYSMQELSAVTVQAALAHPTWNMGAKITIDSATLANKGLEVIEAARLFEMPPEKISVTIHPQSIVHSMIRVASGALYAELSKPDMRLPIHNALYHEHHEHSPFAHLDFNAPAASPLNLSFSEPDTKRFPMLALAYTALRAGTLYPIVYNAANEEAVAMFAAGHIGFLDIPRICEAALSKNWTGKAATIDEILEIDGQARSLARRHIL